ncbi:ABC transporter ATP-binding protein [Companilactobacillus sp. DQM5]|uniref:ABC transporter ATP-binding protein n=1 Tax=Companilactobacillus sp. DQM5 TaxID=3463359 RepID=UPI00405846A5
MDKNSQENSMLDMFTFVFRTVLKRRWLLISNILLLIIITFLKFVMPQFTQFIIDKVIPKSDYRLLLLSIITLLITAAILGIFNYLSTYYIGVMSQNSITKLRENLYKDILRMDTNFFKSSKTGDLMERLNGDINNLQSLISPNMLAMIGNIFTFIGVLSFLFIENWIIALAVSLTLPFMFLIYRVFRNRIRSAFMKVRASQAKMSNQMQNTLTQIQLIKSYSSEDFEEERFNKFAHDNRENNINAIQNQAIFSPLVDFINYLGTAIVLLLGTYFVIHRQLTIGQLVAYISYVSMLQTPIRAMTALLNQLQQSLVSYGRITEILKTEPEIVDSPEAVDFPKLSNGIFLNKVYFKYPNKESSGKNPSVLKDITFNIPFGKVTALVGHSGAGKTTITQLLDRLFDINSGKILYDDTPISKIKINSLRKNISIVAQDILITDGTLEENIRYGNQDASDEEVWQAAKIADIDKFISDLPDGIKTQVGERGMRLSGGQKQRISIARAVLKNAPVIILDEATAALDNESEKNIQHALDNLLKNKTSLVIAHRLSTVHSADKIVVMDNGKVVETGTHNELLEKNGQYAQLYNAQFK